MAMSPMMREYCKTKENYKKEWKTEEFMFAFQQIYVLYRGKQKEIRWVSNGFIPLPACLFLISNDCQLDKGSTVLTR